MTLWNKTWHVCSLPHKHSHTHPTSSPAIASSLEIPFFISLLCPRLLESFLSQSLSVARAPTRHLFPPRSLNISLLSSLLLSISPEFHHFGSLRKSCWHFSCNFFLSSLHSPPSRRHAAAPPPHLSRSHRYHSDLFTRVLLFIRSLPVIRQTCHMHPPCFIQRRFPSRSFFYPPCLCSSLSVFLFLTPTYSRYTVCVFLSFHLSDGSVP